MSARLLAARVWWAVTLSVGLGGCAGMQFPSIGEHLRVAATDAARECSTPSPKLERTARAAVGVVKGAVLGAVGGAGLGLLFAAAYPGGCFEPTACAAYVGGIVTIGAVAGSVVGSVEGARTAWREPIVAARDVHACNTGRET